MRKPVADGAGKHVQVQVGNLLKGRLDVGHAPVHAIARQSGSAQRPGEAPRDPEHGGTEFLVEVREVLGMRLRIDEHMPA